MRKDEFLGKLEMLLSDISEEEREEAMAFYRSYFEDAGIGNEARIIAELGSPENVAEIIKRDLGMVTVGSEASYSENYSRESEQSQQNSDSYYKWSENQQSTSYGNYTDESVKKDDTWKIVLLVVIAVATFPVWFGFLSSLLGTVLGFSVALVAITFAMFVVGITFVGLGIAMLAGLSAAVVSVPVGLAFIGSGLLVLAIALMLLLACVAVFGRFYPWVCKGIYGLCKKAFGKKEAQAA